jgi:oxygen-dependent protoporphyrinogen oxidase
MARAEFRDLLGVRGDPIVARTRHWPRGLPQYRLGHQDRIATLRGIDERCPGLFVTGNYFIGPGITSCLTQARQTSVRMHGFLLDSVRDTRPSDIARTTAVR